MKKSQGFTLIELLAVIVILGVIMIIAIPSVTNYITNSRKDSYVSDAKMFLDAAKTQLTADEELPHGTGEKVIIPISDIALDKGGEKSPFGNDWDLGKSYVVVENIGTSSDPEYVWKVALADAKGNCIPLTNDTDLKRDVVGTGCTISETLISKIIASGTSVDTSLDFNVAPTETTSGVFVRNGTENDTNPIYYYRGVVSNNNVRFANFCWKIVRTTETGGIKLIYNGVPAVDGSCNNTGEVSQIAAGSFNTISTDNAYIGYMYGKTAQSTYEATHTNTNNSSIKNIIDAWYSVSLDSYTTMLEDTVWCNDRSFANNDNTGTGTGSSLTRYAAFERILNVNSQPSLNCINNNDKFTVSSTNGNGALTYPVGLLTADEVYLTGSILNNNGSSYLSTGQYWWLGTPYQFNGTDGRIFRVNPSGGMNVGYVHIANEGIRPAISLKSGTLVTGGDGSVQTPYVVE